MFGALSPYVFVKALLLAVGLWWCIRILGRFSRDLARVRGNADATEKGVIIVFWLITAGILFCIVRFVAGLVKAILPYF